MLKRSLNCLLRGSVSFVEPIFEPQRPPARLSQRSTAVEGSAVREILKLTQRSEVLSLAGGLPAPELFDLPGLAAAFDRALGGQDARRHLQYSITEGDPDLRAHLSGLTTARGLDADAAATLVTTGSQQALDLVASALLDPGDVVVVERPCYLAALQLFSLLGLRVVTAATDDEGLDPEAVRAVLRAHAGTVIYTVATFQNPTGVSLSPERRRALAEVAREEGAWIIEDDPYGELRYYGEPVAPVAADDPERVVYVSSLSKVVAPGLRIGWVVAPPPLRRAMVNAKQARDLHTSTIDQRAAFEYLDTGALEPHLERIRAAYRIRLDTMLAGLERVLPDGGGWTTPEGGMFVWVTLPEGTDTGDLLAAAVREGVAYVPGAPFYAEDPVANCARVSFSTLSPPAIDEALDRLGRALAS